AWRLDYGAVSVAAAARMHGDDVTEERADLALRLPLAAAHVAGHGVSSRLAAGSRTGRAEHRGIHSDVALHAEHHLGELHVDADESVFTALFACARSAAAAAEPSAAEERLEDVTEAAHAAGLVAAHVVALALV